MLLQIETTFYAMMLSWMPLMAHNYDPYAIHLNSYLDLSGHNYTSK